MIWAYRQEEPEESSEAWLEELVRSQPGEEEQENENLYCFICGEVITSTSQRISVQGAHQHTFSNPAGYVFEIGCFRQAPGCRQTGESTDFYSWFDGYAWRYAVCRNCRVHLGWFFQGGDPEAEERADRFFALMLNRLLKSKECLPSES